jgi:hypothetical protein
MSITLSPSATNNADWDEIWEFSASYDGGATFDLIDFTGVSIDVQIRDADDCMRIQATTDNGKITIVDVGRLEIIVAESEMSNLCPGTYRIGGRFTVSESVVSLFTGSLSIIDGVAR